jgi:hypothetical protein
VRYTVLGEDDAGNAPPAGKERSICLLPFSHLITERGGGRGTRSLADDLCVWGSTLQVQVVRGSCVDRGEGLCLPVLPLSTQTLNLAFSFASSGVGGRKESSVALQVEVLVEYLTEWSDPTSPPPQGVEGGEKDAAGRGKEQNFTFIRK